MYYCCHTEFERIVAALLLRKSSEPVLDQTKEGLEAVREKLMHTATEQRDRDFYTAAHIHTFYICSVSEGEKGLFSTEISIKRIQLNCTQ